MDTLDFPSASSSGDQDQTNVPSPGSPKPMDVTNLPSPTTTENEKAGKICASPAVKQEGQDDGSEGDSSIPCAPTTNEYEFVSPSTPHRLPLATANSPTKKQGASNPSTTACEMTPTIRNTTSQYSTNPMTTAGMHLLPTVSPEEDPDLPREIGYFMDSGAGQSSIFGEEDTNGTYRVNRRLELPDKDSDSMPRGSQRFLCSVSRSRSLGLMDIRSIRATQAAVSVDCRSGMVLNDMNPCYEEDAYSNMYEDDDCDDTLEDPDLNYQEEEEGEDHIGKIHFPVRDSCSHNLSFRSLDEGGFRRAMRSSSVRAMVARSSPLTVGRSPLLGLERAYQPSRENSLTEFGLRDSAVEAAAIFKDDDEASLYHPIPLKKGNSTGTHFSIPSIRHGMPLASVLGDDCSSIRSGMDIGSDGWWNESMSDVGSLRGSFDEADGMTVGSRDVVIAPPARDGKQHVYEWLEDVKSQGNCAVAEAASSKFLREQTSSLTAPVASTRFTPVAVGGKPPRALKRHASVPVIERGTNVPAQQC